jgi:hypothetical protein
MEDRYPGISGLVIGAETRRGLPGLRVELWDRSVPDQTLVGVTVTDADGDFEIPLGESFAAGLTEVIFRVFDGGDPVKNVEYEVGREVLAGETGVVIEVGTPAVSAGSTEVALHELGESIAVTVASVQEELARYPNDLGAYVLDEVDLNVPVQLRVDELGQVKATVVEGEAPSSTVGQLHLRLRPILGASQNPPPTSVRPLDTLGALSPQEIARLEAERVFSVDDLMRVARNASGRAALTKFGLETDLERVLDRAEVLSLPMLPAPVAESLLQVGVEAPADFVNEDPAKLAESLSERLGQTLSTEDVSSWQSKVGEVLAFPLPSQQQQAQES